MPRNYTPYLENLRVEIKDRILTLILHNPDKLNANTPAMHSALSRIWDEIHDDPDVDLVILTGAGERAFSAGGDAQQLQDMIDDPESWWRNIPESRRIINRMLECEKPIIARVNGHAIGLGAALVLCADISVAVETAKIGDPHTGVGLVCGDGGALLFPQHVGFAKAKELVLTGALLTGREAADIGLINHAVPREQLDAKVMEIARLILGRGQRAVRLTKATMNLHLRQVAQITMELGAANELLSAASKDHREAVRAMLEKRKPVFRGE